MFNFELFFFLTTSIFLLCCSILDIKYRQISNKFILYFLIVGFVSKIIQSLILSNFSFIFNSLVCLGLSFIVLFILWELGIISGADVKIFLVISLLNPLNLAFFSENVFVSSKVLFPLTLLILSLLLLAPYVFIYGLTYIIIKKPKLLLEQLITAKSFLSLLCSVVVIYLINLFIDIFYKNYSLLFIAIISILIYFLFSKIKIYCSEISLLIFLGIFFSMIFLNNLLFKWFTFNLTELLFIFIYITLINILSKLYILIKNNALVTTKLILNLKAGDLLYYNYYKKGSKVYFDKIGFFKHIKLLLKNKYYLNLKIDSKKACGINDSDIRFLRTMYKHNLISKYVLVRKTIPYTPAILIAYILLNIFGDFIWLII